MNQFTEPSQLKTINEVKEKKQLIINEQKPKTKEILESSRKQRKIEMACFWTWPWGHAWGRNHCKVCGKWCPSDMA